MPRAVALILALVVLTGSLAAQPAAPTGPPVRLVLLLVIDQFRADYLTRFAAEYTGGITQLLAQGAVFTNAYLEHYPTVTAVGHAAMLTGATPAKTGIIGNDWFDRETGQVVTSVSDEKTAILGAGNGTGLGSSPRRLQAETLADQIKKASRAPRDSDGAPRTIGLSLKDRSAILTVGRSANLAVWIDRDSGRFVTSTYYRKDLPAWVAAFNNRKPADRFAGTKWEFLDPASGSPRGFPAEVGTRLYDAVYASPHGNDILAALAKAAIEAERLGQRNATDLLSVSFSSNDAVGHGYGPDSPEVRDISVRTDRTLADLLAYVDQRVGLAHTLVILTSDHGVAPLPEVQVARQQPGGRVSGQALFVAIREAIEKKYGPGTWLVGTAGSSPYLNHAFIAQKGLDPAEVRRVAAEGARSAPKVTRVYTREDFLKGRVPKDEIGRRLARSYHPDRSGDLEVILEPYYLRSAAGTTHGTPYEYDAHIPIILMGPGVRPGTYAAPAAMDDLAPTVSALIGVKAPNRSDGRVLAEALGPGVAATR